MIVEHSSSMEHEELSRWFRTVANSGSFLRHYKGAATKGNLNPTSDESLSSVLTEVWQGLNRCKLDFVSLTVHALQRALYVSQKQPQKHLE